ncbi:hypothetical protein D3C75_1191650 [compost metagenome]
MHHRAGVTFGFGDIRPVVVDAVTVESHRAVAKQQDRRGRYRLLPTREGQCFAAGKSGRGWLAIDNILLLANRQAPVLHIVVAQGGKQQ